MRQYKKHYLRIRFKEKMDAYSIAKAVYVCIERKLMKVARYVTQGQRCYI